MTASDAVTPFVVALASPHVPQWFAMVRVRAWLLHGRHGSRAGAVRVGVASPRDGPWRTAYRSPAPWAAASSTSGSSVAQAEAMGRSHHGVGATVSRSSARSGPS